MSANSFVSLIGVIYSSVLFHNVFRGSCFYNGDMF